MACSNRKGNNPTALNAIEIPNDLAISLQNNQPQVFEKLKNNGCLVIFVEFDVLQKNEEFQYRSKGSNTRGGDSSSKSAGTSKGVSAYSVVGQGDNIKDNSTSVHLEGKRKLKQVSGFVVGVTVVNTNKQKINSEQAKQVATLLDMRAKQIHKEYEAFELYTYEMVRTEINNFLKPFGLHTSSSDIFEHALLNRAGIVEEPKSCGWANPKKEKMHYMLNWIFLSSLSKQL